MINSSGSFSPKKPFPSVYAFDSWCVHPVSTDTGAARQESQNSMTKFHEFVELLCEIAGQSKGHSIIFSCLNFLKAVWPSCLGFLKDFFPTRIHPNKIIFAFLQVSER
jgi:hypothetical protein